MHRREFLLSATGIVGATTVGSMAYTTASVDRSVTANVADDASAIIQLSPGSVSGVSLNGDGKLEVNPPDDLNKDATFEFGNPDDPAANPAFTITNNDTVEQTISIGLSNFDSSGIFKLDLSGPSTTDSVSDNSTTVDFTLGDGETIDAAITINTGTSDISGQMNFDA
jgi:hypothetical protein